MTFEQRVDLLGFANRFWTRGNVVTLDAQTRGGRLGHQCHPREGTATAPAPDRRCFRGRRAARWPLPGRRGRQRRRPTLGVPPGAQTAPVRPSTSASLAALAPPANTRATASSAAHLAAQLGSTGVGPISGHGHCDGVGAEHDVGVEQSQQRREVAVARGGEERGDHLALARGRTVVRDCRVSLHAPAGPAGQLAGGGRRPPDDRGDLLERNREHVVQHERQPLGRRQGVQHDQQGQADRVGEQRLVLGRARRGRTTGLGSDGSSAATSRFVARARSMSRQTRATTVVSQPPRLSTASASARLSRSHASCTASSASWARPEHPERDRPQVLTVGLEVLGEQVGSFTVTSSGLRSSYRLTRRTGSM